MGRIGGASGSMVEVGKSGVGLVGWGNCRSVGGCISREGYAGGCSKNIPVRVLGDKKNTAPRLGWVAGLS